MKRFYTILTIIFFVSCQTKNKENHLDIQRKYDSILNLKKEITNNPFFKFSNILKKEKNLLIDSVLINDYKLLLGKNKELDFYIWDRINAINKIPNFDIIKKYEGEYKLLIQGLENSNINRVKISKDSIYLYKGRNIVVADKNNFSFTSEKYNDGRMILGRYFIQLNSAFKKKVFIKDNFCMDCATLMFSK